MFIMFFSPPPSYTKTMKVIHVLYDEIVRNYTTLYTALPRESASKEVDAAVLAVISYPAFAIHDVAKVEKTRNEIVKKLGGRYGFKRFLRDGHQTVLENTSRLHYDPTELKMFEGIESEWPLFFTYMTLDGLFRGDYQQVEEYRMKLEPLLVDSSHVAKYNGTTPGRISSPLRAVSPKPTSKAVWNMQLVPELYIVPKECVESEKKEPGSQEREANENLPLVWAQSLYILGNLIYDDLLSPSEIDPLGRRLLPLGRGSKTDVVVQVVLLSENAELQSKLRMFGLETQLIQDCDPIIISPPSALRDAFTALGENTKLVCCQHLKIMRISCLRLGSYWSSSASRRLTQYVQALPLPRAIILFSASFHEQRGVLSRQRQ